MQVLTDEYEINKSSDLCQLVYFTETKKEKQLFNITSLQLDLLNVVFYQANKYLVNSKIDLDLGDTTTIELDTLELSKMLGRYNKAQYEYLISSLTELSDVKVLINALNKNKQLQETSITRFILSIKLSKHLKTNKKKLRIVMDNDILKRVHNIKTLFSKMFLSIQLSMSSKYSKLLYELLKDYHGIETLTIPFASQLDLLNVTEPSMQQWANFRPHIIDKAIQEINAKSDIFVTYTPIKEKPEGERMQVTKIKFSITKQPESRLKELGLIQESIIDNKFYNKSKSKLDALVKNGYTVVDAELWIETDIRKNESKYDAELRLDAWLKETDKEDQKKIYEMIANEISECDDPMAIIDDYQIKGIFSKETFTKNALETIEILNSVISKLSVN